MRLRRGVGDLAIVQRGVEEAGVGGRGRTGVSDCSDASQFAYPDVGVAAPERGVAAPSRRIDSAWWLPPGVLGGPVKFRCVGRNDDGGVNGAADAAWPMLPPPKFREPERGAVLGPPPPGPLPPGPPPPGPLPPGPLPPGPPPPGAPLGISYFGGTSKCVARLGFTASRPPSSCQS